MAQIFSNKGIPITQKQITLHNNFSTQIHIEAICRDPVIQQYWDLKFGRFPQKIDTDQLFQDFTKEQCDNIQNWAVMVPRSKDALMAGNETCLKIGVITGFDHTIMERILQYNDLKVDSIVSLHDCTKDKMHSSMPWIPHIPSMVSVTKSLINMKIPFSNEVVKVSSTVNDIRESLYAGCWAVGITDYSRHLDKVKGLGCIEKNLKVKDKMVRAGAHYTIDNLSDLSWIIKKINEQVTQGITP